MLLALLLDADYSGIYRLFDVLFFLFLAALAAGLVWLTVKAVRRAKAKRARGERWGVAFLLLIGLLVGVVALLLLQDLLFALQHR